jgi:hypothetical protein
MASAHVSEAADLPTKKVFKPVLVGKNLIGGYMRSHLGEGDVVPSVASDLEPPP